MIKSNFHIHSTYCDGKDTLEEMVIAAIEAGLLRIGFSGHLPLLCQNDWTMPENEVVNYLEEVNILKSKYAHQIEISLGMEIDYYIDLKDISPLGKRLIPELDYFIGSIHTVGKNKQGLYYDLDYKPEILAEGIEDCFEGSARDFVEAYYEAIGDMAETLHPDIIGHLDLVKKNNPEAFFFDETADWYQAVTANCLDRIAKTGCIVEINTGGMIRYGERCLYPSIQLMQGLKEREIPITLNGDSHSVEGICYAYPQIENLLKTLGFESIRVLEKGTWVSERF